MRVETHCHTKYSKDSMMPFGLLYMKCRLLKIEYIAITEHNNIQGALAFHDYCQRRGGKLHVIIGEEVMTSSGEIIGLFLKEEIPKGLSAEETVERIENQRGVVYIPHPYDNKRQKTVLKEEKIKSLKDRIQCIECHNGRNISLEYDKKQCEMAEKYGLTKVIGSDAHTIWEIGRNYMIFSVEPNSPENFCKAIENVEFHSAPCLQFAHKITKIAKLIKMLQRGDYSEVYRIIHKKFRKRM